jgi:hypothetical protein
MSRLELAPWRGQLGNSGVVAKIRRKIAGRIRQGECVLLDFEQVTLTAEQLAELIQDWPAARVKFCGCREVLAFPLPTGAVSSSCL